MDVFQNMNESFIVKVIKKQKPEIKTKRAKCWQKETKPRAHLKKLRTKRDDSDDEMEDENQQPAHQASSPVLSNIAEVVDESQSSSNFQAHPSEYIDYNTLAPKS